MKELLKKLGRPLRNVTTQKYHGFVYSKDAPLASTSVEKGAYEVIKKLTKYDLTPDIWAGLSAGHINCGNCYHHGFYLNLDPKNSLLVSSCTKCDSEGRISLAGILNPNFPISGDLECENGHRKFALMKSGTTCCIGCLSCAFQIDFTLNIRNGIWVQ